MKKFSKFIGAMILSGLIAGPVFAVAAKNNSTPKSQACSYNMDGEKICMGEDLFKEAVKQTIFSVGTHILNKYMPKNSNQNPNNSNNQVQYTTNTNTNNNNSSSSNNNQNNQQNKVVEEQMVPISGNSNSNSGVPASSSQQVVEEMIPL